VEFIWIFIHTLFNFMIIAIIIFLILCLRFHPLHCH
jgi:hypothetical protein